MTLIAWRRLTLGQVEAICSYCSSLDPVQGGTCNACPFHGTETYYPPQGVQEPPRTMTVCGFSAQPRSWTWGRITHTGCPPFKPLEMAPVGPWQQYAAVPGGGSFIDALNSRLKEQGRGDLAIAADLLHDSSELLHTS